MFLCTVVQGSGAICLTSVPLWLAPRGPGPHPAYRKSQKDREDPAALPAPEALATCSDPGHGPGKESPCPPSGSWALDHPQPRGTPTTVIRAALSCALVGSGHRVSWGHWWRPASFPTPGTHGSIHALLCWIPIQPFCPPCQGPGNNLLWVKPKTLVYSHIHLC